MARKISMLFFLSMTLICFAQIERVEPAFWWVGMKNPTLQLLIHGNDISNRNVTFNYQGVTVLKVDRATSPNYLFVTIKIDAKKVKAGKFEFQLTEKGKPNLNFEYELRNRNNGSAQRKSFNSSDVIYLLMPDRFANGNPANDNIESQQDKLNRTSPNGRHGGDIQGIQEHLDYIKELGATAIWSTPLMENNYKKVTYHGYAISDYYKTDPRYGSNEEYVAFVEKAHQKGLKIIMDMVSNHCGIDAWWMKDLPFEDWIHQWKTYTNSNFKAKTIRDNHAAETDKKLMTDGWFDTTMPDLNQQNPFFLTYFIQNSIWWIEYSNLDGIRMDTYPYNDRNGMAKWAKAITDEYPNFNIVGETWVSSTQDIAFWQKNSINALKYNSYLPSVMDFSLQSAISNCFNEHGNAWEDVGMNRLYNTIADDYLYPNINNLLIFFENHDTQRFNNIVKGNLAKYKMAMSLLMTTRGIPQIYYGTEIGMTGNKDKGDGDIRRDFPGGWAGDSINAFIQSGRTEMQAEYYNFTSKLMNWRKNKSVIHNGELLHYAPQNDIYVYFRYNEKERIVVIINNNETEQTLKTERFEEGLKGFKFGKDVMTNVVFDLTNAIPIPKQTALILELQ
jgi:neopullulanase